MIDTPQIVTDLIFMIAFFGLIVYITIILDVGIKASQQSNPSLKQIAKRNERRAERKRLGIENKMEGEMSKRQHEAQVALKKAHIKREQRREKQNKNT